MTTREQACQLSSLRSEHQPCARTVENIPFLSLNSHLSNYDTLCPKMFPLLIREKGIRAEGCEEDGEVGAANGGSEGWLGHKSFTVSPLDLLLTPCECVTGRQVPRSPNNTSSHPENLPFQPPVACVPSPEYRLKIPLQTLGPYSVPYGQPNCCRLH